MLGPKARGPARSPTSQSPVSPKPEKSRPVPSLLLLLLAVMLLLLHGLVGLERVHPRLPVLHRLSAEVPVAVVDRDVEAELVQLVGLHIGFLE